MNTIIETSHGKANLFCFATNKNRNAMKNCLQTIFVVLLGLILSSCLGPTKFDATNDGTIQESTRKIVESMPEEQQEEFGKAIIYFSLGGSSGFESLLGAAFTGELSEVTPEAMIAINLKSIDGLTGEEIIRKHHASIEQERIVNEQARTVNSLKEEAQKLLEDNEFKDAIDKYKALGEISSGIEATEPETAKIINEAAEAGIAETIAAMEDFTEKVNYMEKVKITEFSTKRIDTFLKENIPAVRIALKNTGDRSLDEVEVTVYFEDKDGNAIFEEDFYPVLVSEYSFGDDNKPLKPGYVKEMEKDRYYTIDLQLTEWVEGNATAKITDIKFSDDEAAEAGIAETIAAMEDFTEKMNYMEKVKITEFSTKRIDTFSGENIPAVRIALKNTGDRSLDEVEVTVYFEDKDGNAIFEEDFYPVLVSEYSFGDDNKPLKPGYVKEMEKDRYYTIDLQLTEWVEGNATAKITDIKFSE